MARLSEWTQQVEMAPPQVDVLDADFAEVVNDENTSSAVEPLTELLAKLGSASLHTYTSDEMENDFTVSVELLMETHTYLKIFSDVVRRFGILSVTQEKDFKEHLEKVEEFTHQWG
jgi:hypothetical protein